jgi:hypothetical protein
VKDLLLKFYDKIVLGILLLVLAATLIVLTNALNAARATVKIADDDFLTSVSKKSEIPPLDEGIFAARIELTDEDNWDRVKAEGNLVDPARYTFARDGSPYLLHYSTRVNPFNKKPDLGAEEGSGTTTAAGSNGGKPTDGDGPTADSGQDSDGDGIPDAVETALGKNPNFAGDANVDTDGDGFSDLEEFRFKTASDNVASHPPLATVLRFHKVIAEPLPVMLFNVTPTDPEDKTTWDIQVRVKVGKSSKQRFTKIGRVISGTTFKVVDASYSVAIKDGVTQKIFQIVVETPGGETVNLTEKKQAYGANSYYQFAYVLEWPPKSVKARLGGKFSLTGKGGKKEVYTLVSAKNGIAVQDAAQKTFKIQKYDARRDQARVSAGSRGALAPRFEE